MTTIWTTYIFPFLVLTGLAVIGYLTKNLLPSYFNEKGKNLATKEDISEITELVETVKSSFSKETEHLKAKLHLLSTVQVGLVDEERNAIVDFNEKYSRWLELLVDFSSLHFNFRDNSDLADYRRALSQAYREVSNTESKFRLFVEDNVLISDMHELKVLTLSKLPSIALERITKLKYNNDRIDLMKRTTPANAQLEPYTEIVTESEGIYYQYGDRAMEHYHAIVPVYMKFQKQCKEHLFRLLRDR